MAAKSFNANSAAQSSFSGNVQPQFAASMINQPTGEIQVSEALFPDLIKTQYNKYQDFMGGADQFVPEVILERPRKRL